MHSSFWYMMLVVEAVSLKLVLWNLELGHGRRYSLLFFSDCWCDVCCNVWHIFKRSLRNISIMVTGSGVGRGINSDSNQLPDSGRTCRYGISGVGWILAGMRRETMLIRFIKVPSNPLLIGGHQIPMAMYLDRRHTWKKHMLTKPKQLGLKFKKLMYWLNNKVLLY